MEETNNTAEQYEGKPEHYEGKPGHDRRLTKAARVLFGILALLGIVCFILTFSAKFIAAAVMCALAGFARKVKNKKGLIDRIIASAILLACMFCIAPLGISSHALWQYPFQRFYIGCYQNVKEPEWFPDFRGDVMSDYSFEYVASVMQGTGHYNVMFRTSPERAAQYAEEFSAKAKYIIPLNDYSNTVNKIISEETAKGNAQEYDSPDFYAPGGFHEYWDGYPDVMIYVTDAVLNRNHPHTSAVIVDAETGSIQLLQLG